MEQITLGAISLPPDMFWSDELSWLPVGATVKTTLTGAEVIQVGRVQAARPITLEGGSDFAWIDYETAEALRTLASDPDARFNLRLVDGRTYTVRFRIEEGSAIEAVPVEHRATPDTSVRNHLQYIPTIRLKTVTA